MQSCVLGAQWGDEGKGKLTDSLIAKGTKYCVRFNGGHNAGHTIVVDGKKFAFHLLPSGMISPNCVGVVGNGCVMHLPTLEREIAGLNANGVSHVGRLFISDRAHLVLDWHQLVDGAQERGSDKPIGTTGKGIGPTYSNKSARVGIRMCDLLNFPVFEAKLRILHDRMSRHYPTANIPGADGLAAELERYRSYAATYGPMIVDTGILLHRAVRANETILFEGANAAMLDLDHGTYPYVTSSACAVGGVLTGTGLNVRDVAGMEVYGVVKAYTTRVGDGPFPTEDKGPAGTYTQKNGHEFGTTTGRARRCGWLDLVVVAYTARLNGYTQLNITKLDTLSGVPADKLKVAVAYKHNGVTLPSMPADLDVLQHVEVEYVEMDKWDDVITACRSFDQLPKAARDYVMLIQNTVGVPVTSIGVGPGRDALILLPKA